MVVVDAHQHVWDPAFAAYPWLTPELGRLARTFTHAEVAPQMTAVGVDVCVLVQAADNLDDTENMLQEAATNATVAGVVAWAPLDQPRQTARLLDQWAARGAPVVGVRHLLHREPDPDWVLRPEVLLGLDVLAARGLAFDFCAESPALLRNVSRLADLRPSLRIVVDHLGKPPIAQEGWQPWADLLARAAGHPEVVAKVSGLNTAAGEGRRAAADLRPYVDHALESFGPQRLMYGGDWPFALLAADSYADVWSPLRRCLDDLTPHERDDVLGGTARQTYRLA